MRIRSFELSDFPFLARAMDEEWGWELKGCTKGERDALACFYSAAAVGACNTVFCAVDAQNTPCAFLCAELFAHPKRTPAENLHWQFLVQSSQEILCASAAGKEVLHFYEQIAAVNRRLLAKTRETGFIPQSELRFFITARAARGKGAGKLLLTQFADHLRAKGVSHCILFTDSHCAWQFYEKTGWRRAAEERWDCAGQPIDAFAYVKSF